MIVAVIEALIDFVFERTGRWLFSLFGLKRSSLAALFAGMTFWATIAILIVQASRY